MNYFVVEGSTVTEPTVIEELLSVIGGECDYGIIVPFCLKCFY